MIDGRGAGPHILLGDVKKDKQSIFRFQEKYKNILFMNKDPGGPAVTFVYYTDGGDESLSKDKLHHKIADVWRQKYVSILQVLPTIVI